MTGQDTGQADTRPLAVDYGGFTGTRIAFSAVTAYIAMN